MTGKREVEKMLRNLESDGGDRDRRPLPPAQARRMRRAFEEFGVDDPERAAHMFVYGPAGEGGEFTDDVAEAVRTIEWRERFGEELPWSDDADDVGRGTGTDSDNRDT